jgi:hypothetical protein
LLTLSLQSRTWLGNENLFLRKQLACYFERNVRPRRTDSASRITLVVLSPFVEWQRLLTIVRPDTFIRWHREMFRLFWRRKSRRRGRPRIPAELQRLIADMARANRTWGEERIAAELRLKHALIQALIPVGLEAFHVTQGRGLRTLSQDHPWGTAITSRSQ